MKYRVYDTKRKKYVTDLPYWILKPNGELAENLYGDEIGRSECIVEFSSGIPDQNGIEIYDGDIVFIRKQSMVDNGEIAAVVIDDEATLKRVNYYPEKNLLILKAENPDYEDLVYTGEQLDHIIILGKAVAFQSDVR